MASVGPPTSSVADLIAREDYRPQLYLAERKDWSFAALRNELNTCLDGVRSQLVELINHDYQDFIDLSSDLRGIEPVLDHLKQPLLSMQQTVQETHAAVEALGDRVSSQLKRRTELTAKKQVLMLFLNLNDGLNKLYTSLGLPPAEETEEAAKEDEEQEEEEEDYDLPLQQLVEKGKRDSGFFWHLAMELNQTMYLMDRASAFPFAKTLHHVSLGTFLQEKDVSDDERVEKRLRLLLERNLKQTLRPFQLGEAVGQHKVRHILPSASNVTDLENALRSAVAAHMASPIKVIVQRMVVQPVLSAFVEQQMLTSRVLQTRSFYATVIEAMSDTSLQPPYFQTLSEILTKHHIHFWTAILFPAAVACLLAYKEKERADIFLVTKGDDWVDLYHESRRFLNHFEERCANAAEVQTFRSSASYNAFVDAWQSGVWFQLLYRQWTTDLESTFQRPLADATIKKCPMYEATSCFEETLTSLWCPKHLLLPVLNRSVKTLCQLCVRYSQWLSEHIDAQRAVDETALQRLSLLVGLYLDAHLVQRKTRRALAQTLPKEIAQVLDATLLETVEQICCKAIGEPLQRCRDVVGPLYIEEMSDTIKSCRAVVQQYRRTNRPPPTQPSAYVQDLFAPLTALQQAWQATEAEKDALREVMESVTSAIETEFETHMEDTLVNLAKVEESLKRFQRQAKKEEAATPEMSDEDKMRQQLRLDHEAIKAQALALIR